MNEIQVFINEEFGKVRSVTINGEPWFVGKDVADALGYENPSKAVRDHVDDEDKIMGVQNVTPYIIDNMKRIQYPTWINESGLYCLIMSSKLPSAKRFKHWVTSEVLPAIRKSGRYGRNTYRIQDAPIGEVTALLHEVSSFLREMDRVMRDQNSHPSDIAEEFKSVCSQLGVVSLSDNFVKEPYVCEPCFMPLEVIMGCGDDLEAREGF